VKIPIVDAGSLSAPDLAAGLRLVQQRRSDLMNCAARSPMTTHGAIVLPVAIRGMIEASATRRFSMPARL
jgi:hypothetical protein